MNVLNQIPSVSRGEELYCRPDGIYVISKDLDNDEVVVQASAPHKGGMVLDLAQHGYGVECKPIGDLSRYFVNLSATAFSTPPPRYTRSALPLTATTLQNAATEVGDQAVSAWTLAIAGTVVPFSDGQGSPTIGESEDQSTSLGNHEMLSNGYEANSALTFTFAGLTPYQKLSIELVSSATPVEGEGHTFTVGGDVSGLTLDMDGDVVYGDVKMFIVDADMNGDATVTLTPNDTEILFINGFSIQELGKVDPSIA